MKSTRFPAVSGLFYPSSKDSLIKQIENCFLSHIGPGSLPRLNPKGKREIVALVVPHAGYMYSGAIASHSYCHLIENGFANTFIILGPNHTGVGSGVSLMTEGAWETPLGTIHIDETLAGRAWTGIIDNDASAHRYEHSIEVQLPFLQYIKQKFSFVPICMAMQDYETSREVGVILADSIKDLKKEAVIIASSDFSHVGFNYMSMPPSGIRVDEYAKKQDKLALDQIMQMSAEGLINTVHKNNISMCGYGPVAVMLVAAKELGARHVELLKYGTSYEVYPSDSCVGYGALIVY